MGNEKQLKLEISAEEAAERREYKAESRMNLLSIKKCVELSEARCQNRAFDKKELVQIEEIGKTNVEIESYEEWRDRIFAEEDAYRKSKKKRSNVWKSKQKKESWQKSERRKLKKSTMQQRIKRRKKKMKRKQRKKLRRT